MIASRALVGLVSSLFRDDVCNAGRANRVAFTMLLRAQLGQFAVGRGRGRHFEGELARSCMGA